MKNKTIIQVLIFLLISFQVNSTIYISIPLEDEIDEADLIIRGELIKKYSQNEAIKRYLTNAKGEVKFTVENSIFTTFTFSVDEVLKGSYSKNEIEVKMLGGCNVENSCDDYSFNYDYKIQEQALLFLRYNKKNNTYQATQASHTAFSIDKDNNLIRKSEDREANAGESSSRNIGHSGSSYYTLNDKDEMVLKTSLNLPHLKSTIEKVKNEY